MVANTAGSTVRTLTFLPPPPWTSHLSCTGERCWLESYTLTSSPAVLLQPLARAGCEWEPERLDGISFAMWSSFFPTAGTDCWEVNHFGGQVVLVSTSWRKCFPGVVCVYTGHVWGGLLMSSMLACLLCCPSELLLFGADRLCIEVKKVWLQLLKPEIRRGWTRKSQEC